MLFCCFEEFSGKFTENISSLAKKWLSQKRAQKYSENLFFLTYLKSANPEEHFDMLKQLFYQTSKMGEILIKTFFFTKVSHTELNYAFLLFWNIFGEIHREHLFLVQKVTISEKSSEKLRKLVFHNKIEKW